MLANRVNSVRELPVPSQTAAPQQPWKDIASQEAQAAGARATIIDAQGKVLADSEADAASMENHAARPEFVAGYREAADWMYADPKAVEMYSEKVKLPVDLLKVDREVFAEPAGQTGPAPAISWSRTESESRALPPPATFIRAPDIESTVRESIAFTT